MRGAVMYAPGDVRVEERADPQIIEPTDAIIRLSATCICGSDLWPYRGIDAVDGPAPMGHEYVRHRRGGRQRGQHDQARPVRRRVVLRLRQHLRDLPGRLPELLRPPEPDRRHRRPGRVRPRPARRRHPGRHPRACRPTTWSRASWPPPTCWAPAGSRAVAAEVGPGKTVAVVGDGAVGLLGVLAAKQLGAERIIAMSRHEPRQKLAREFGATDIVDRARRRGRGAIKELTDGLGAHSVIEAVGTQESMMQAIRSTRPGGHVGYVGVSHGVALPGEELFFSHVHLHGGPAPVRRFLPELIDLIWNRHDRPRQGLRPDPAPGSGGRGLPRHGRAPRDQGTCSRP